MVAPLAVCAILMPIAVLLVHIYFKRHRSRRSRAIEHGRPCRAAFALTCGAKNTTVYATVQLLHLAS
ncbi:hypothetical protein MTO96_035040 [Rhipicephalus appendiculatus]